MKSILLPKHPCVSVILSRIIYGAAFMRYASNIKYSTCNYFTMCSLRNRAGKCMTGYLSNEIYIYSTLIEILVMIWLQRKAYIPHIYAPLLGLYIYSKIDRYCFGDIATYLGEQHARYVTTYLDMWYIFVARSEAVQNTKYVSSCIRVGLVNNDKKYK